MVMDSELHNHLEKPMFLRPLPYVLSQNIQTKLNAVTSSTEKLEDFHWFQIWGPKNGEQILQNHPTLVFYRGLSPVVFPPGPASSLGTNVFGLDVLRLVTTAIFQPWPGRNDVSFPTKNG